MNRFSRLRVAVASALALAAFEAPASAIDFSGQYNFRENRVNTPIGSLAGDIIQIGARVADQATSQSPDNVVVKATNSFTGDVVTFNNFGGTSFGALVPYTEGLAQGNWTLNVIDQGTNLSVGSTVLNSIGTAAQNFRADVMPAVSNVQVNTTNSSNPTVSWTLPDLTVGAGPSADRSQVRFSKAGAGTISTFNTTGIGSTAFTPTSLNIDENGLYDAQVMLRNTSPLESRSRNFGQFAVLDQGEGGNPIEFRGGAGDTTDDQGGGTSFSGPFILRSFQNFNSVNFAPSDQIIIGARVEEIGKDFNNQDDEIDGFAINQATGQGFDLNRRFDFPHELVRSFDYDADLTTPFELTAFNGEHVISGTTNSLVDLEKLPFLNNFRLVGDGVTPTLLWNIPDTGGVEFTHVGIGLFDDVTNERLLFCDDPGVANCAEGDRNTLFRHLDVNAAGFDSSFVVPENMLEVDGQYAARVMLEHVVDGGGVANRSVNFLNFTPVDTGGLEIHLPTTDELGIFNFEIDVQTGQPIILDPFVATGYEFAIGQGDSVLFDSIVLPDIGDGVFLVSFLDNLSQQVIEEVLAGALFAFDGLAVSAFTVSGIETSAGLDPQDTSAFMVETTFLGTGQFTGTMTPVSQFVDDATVPEPSTLALLIFGLIGAGFARHRWKTAV